MLIDDSKTKQHTAKERYETLKEKRIQYLDRARICSELTIPALIPEEGFNHTSELYTPFQSVGARGVNNLASKLLLLLLPPNSPFFRLSISGKAKQELEENRELQSEVEKSLQRIEKEVQKIMSIKYSQHWSGGQCSRFQHVLILAKCSE